MILIRRYFILLLFNVAVFISCGQSDHESAGTNFYDLIQQHLTGDRAYETTAYVEQYWRVVGNAGFDSSIYEVVEKLESAGFVDEQTNPKEKLTYRIEKRPLEKPTWEPIDASLFIAGEEQPLLQFFSNRNMIAINSYSTPAEGFAGEVVHVEDITRLNELDVKGKIVYAEAHPYAIYKQAIENGGASGLIVYNNPDYLQPEKNKTSIQFRSIPLDEKNKSWCIVLSFEAKERLEEALSEGEVKVNTTIQTRIYQSEELTVVANVKGREKPKERLVFSAHVQEPGANDNASGVGVAVEMAAVTAQLVKTGKFKPKRTITFLWGDEIVSTRRYVSEDKQRAKGIKWGISLDMVGENTAITGGSFLIEKMPDPSAIWTRGKDEHTEWGATEMSLEDMQPHYLNDFVTNRFKEQGKRADWQVKTNPFEGGSDHVPFLRADIPGVLFWHFTDQFYHTDNDRLDKVSQETLKNVGTAALVSAYTLVNGDSNTALNILEEVKTAALTRLDDELALSMKALAAGASKADQVKIIKAWEDWYLKALETAHDLVDNKSKIKQEIENAQAEVKGKAEQAIYQLTSKNNNQ